MVAAPTFPPETWRQLAPYVRLLVLHQGDHDWARKQAVGSHLTALAPYAVKGGADSAAAGLIAQHYRDEDDKRAGVTPPPPAPDPAAQIEAAAIAQARALVQQALDAIKETTP